MEDQLIFHLIEKVQDMLPLYPLVNKLSPHLTETEYAQCLSEMVTKGYRMVCVIHGSRCVGLAGIWTGTKFYCGKYLEMDNVIIDESFRSDGIGSVLVDYIHRLAQKENCTTCMLDAYLENEAAHRFYEKKGYVKRGYHFLQRMEGVQHPDV
jgi:GNAT superfamily N-acetyltransferase